MITIEIPNTPNIQIQAKSLKEAASKLLDLTMPNKKQSYAEEFLGDPDRHIITGEFDNTDDLFEHLEICRK